MRSIPLTFVLGAAFVVPTAAQTIQAPFNQNYSVRSLGSVPGVPTPYGGVTFRHDDPDVLLISGDANRSNGAVYQIRVTRDANGDITGFQGQATQLATAPYADGGLQYGPGNVLFYTRYPRREVGQITVGSSSTDKVVDLTQAGWSAPSPGALTFVPPGFPSAGHLKICSYSGGSFHDSSLAPDGQGTYDIVNLQSRVTVTGGPEGLLYPPPGSPLLTDYQTMLVCNYSGNSVDVYDLDAQGDPMPSTRRVFMTSVSGAEGATVDASSGAFLFSTFGGGNQVLVVDGFGSCGTFTNYGTGIPGAGGRTPALRGTGCATIDRFIDYAVSNGPPNAPGALNVDTQRLNAPLFGGYLHARPTITITHQLDGQGQWSAPLRAPNDPALVGQRVYFQAVYVDSGAPFGVAASPGLETLIL